MSAVLTRDAGPRILAALGLPVERCAGFSLHFEPNDIVRVEARYHPASDAMEEVIQIVQTFKQSP